MDSSSDVLSWLETTGLYIDVAVRREAEPSRLSEEIVEGLANTSLLIPLLKRLNRLKNRLDRDTTPVPALRKIAEAAANPANAKLKNKYWTVVASCFQAFGVSFQSELIPQAAQGSEDALLSILREVMMKEKQYENSKSEEAKPVETLEGMATEKGLDQSESCVEFLLLSFCSSFEVKPKQAAGLLAQGNKFLARIVAKGLKGDFIPVQNWYQSVYQNSEKLCDLIAQDREKDSLPFTLTVLKVGLESRDEEVVQWCLKTYTKIALDLEDRGLSPQCYAWFLHPSNGAFAPLVATMQRLGAKISSNAAEMLLHYTQLNFIEFFSVHLKNLLPEGKDYFAFLVEMMPAIREMEWAVEALVSSRIIVYWIESASRESDGYQSRCRLTCLHFLVQVFVLFHLSGDEADSELTQLLSTLKKAFRDPAITIKSTAFCLIMELIDTLAAVKSPLASVVYKTATILLVETEPGERIREVVVHQFKRLLVSSSSIPVSVLIEPLCKRIQSIDAGFPMQMADFDLFLVLSRHSRLALKHAILLIDVLGKVYLSDVLYAKAAMNPFSMLVSRFIDSEAMQEYLAALTKVGLVQAAQCDKSAKDKKARFDKFTTYATEENFQDLLLTRRKRDIVLEMVEWLLQLQHERLNQHLKELIVAAALDFRQEHGRDCKGFIMLLRSFGEPQTVISAAVALKAQRAKMENKAESKTENNVEKKAEKEIRSSSEFVSSELEEVKEQALVPYLRNNSDQRRGFPWKRAFADIEQAKKKLKEREQKAHEAEEHLRKLDEIRLGKVALQLEVRKVEQGLSRAPASEVALLKAGQAAKLLTPAEEITLKEFSDAERDDQEAVSLILKRYTRVFKALFHRYSGSGFARKNESTGSIDWFIKRKKCIFDTEYIKLFLDLSVIPDMLSKDELRTILKAYCAKVAHQTELNSVNYEGYLGVFCQFAYFIYSRAPLDLSHLPPAASVRSLIDYMRKKTKALGQSTELYDDPNPGCGDKDVVKKLTKVLATNPDTPMPPGYKRVTDKDVEIVYSVPKELQISEAVGTALEVLDSILSKVAEIHLLEPRVQLITSYRAKGVRQKKERVELPPIHERPPSLLKRKIHEFVEDDKKPAEKPMHLGPVLKYELAHCSEEDRPRMKECAELLEDMLHSITLGTTKVVFREQSQLKLAKAEQAAYAMEDKGRLQSKQDEELRKERKKKKAAMLEKLQKAMEERKKLEADKEAEERQAREKERQRGEAISQKIREEREARKKELKEHRVKQQQEELKAKEEEKAAKATTEEKLKKMKEELRRKMNSRLQEAIEKKQKEGQTKKPAVSAKPSLLEELKQREKQFERTHKGDLKRIEEQKREKEAFQTAAESQELRDALAEYAAKIDLTFDFYCKQSLTKVEQLPHNLFKEMKKSDYSKFLVHFAITPNLVTIDTSSMIFNLLTREKKRSFGVPATLTRADFDLALLHLANESKEVIKTLIASKKENKANFALPKDRKGSDPLTAAFFASFMQITLFSLSLQDLSRRLKSFPTAAERPKRKFVLSASADSLFKAEAGNSHLSDTMTNQPELHAKPATPPQVSPVKSSPSAQD